MFTFPKYPFRLLKHHPQLTNLSLFLLSSGSKFQLWKSFKREILFNGARRRATSSSWSHCDVLPHQWRPIQNEEMLNFCGSSKLFTEAVRCFSYRTFWNGYDFVTYEHQTVKEMPAILLLLSGCKTFSVINCCKVPFCQARQYAESDLQNRRSKAILRKLLRS